jgi:transposase
LLKGQDRRQAAHAACAKQLDWDGPVTEVLSLGRRKIVGGRRALWHGLFQAAPAAACHDPVLEYVVQYLKMRGKRHKFIIVVIARRLVTMANEILKTGVIWRQNPVA